MAQNITQKIIRKHIVDGDLKPGSEIALRIDQTLTQDSTGTMAYLQFEALGIRRVKTKLSVAYIDHNTLQTGPENADDHRYLKTAAARYGAFFSRPGNGICHQVHLERFAAPGMTLLGSDSHTPTAGGMGMLAIGAGGLDVAVAMAGEPYYIPVPRVCNVRLSGSLPPWVSAKDIILYVLQKLSVKGGMGTIFEYSGDGVSRLSVPERATITNMGAELGATTSLFPSDEVTRSFLKAQNREDAWAPIAADPDALYERTIEIDLSQMVPLAAQPHSPDRVTPVADIGPVPVNQVIIGSCTNSSYLDMMKVAAILKESGVHPDTSLVIAPGSRQVLQMLAENGMLAVMISSGARILECACGPCIGMGQSPETGAVSLRTFNRNFQGRSGTPSAEVYLVSPEVAAVSAVTGKLTDPREFGEAPRVTLPSQFSIDDSLILPPSSEDTKVVKGPNIKPFPLNTSLPEQLTGQVLIKLGDDITTDHIMPSFARLLPYRSNVPYLSRYCLTPCDPDFPDRAKRHNGGFIVGGSNYGQGSSREHAALAPLYLGVKGVLAKSFSRIHMANLINNGILPLRIADEDYAALNDGDSLVIDHPAIQIQRGDTVSIRNTTSSKNITAHTPLTPRQKIVICAGGRLNAIKTSADQLPEDPESCTQ